jgi:hypothetical protein
MLRKMKRSLFIDRIYVDKQDKTIRRIRRNRIRKTAAEMICGYMRGFVFGEKVFPCFFSLFSFFMLKLSFVRVFRGCVIAEEKFDREIALFRICDWNI